MDAVAHGRAYPSWDIGGIGVGHEVRAVKLRLSPGWSTVAVDQSSLGLTSAMPVDWAHMPRRGTLPVLVTT